MQSVTNDAMLLVSNPQDASVAKPCTVAIASDVHSVGNKMISIGSVVGVVVPVVLVVGVVVVVSDVVTVVVVVGVVVVVTL